MLCTTSGCRPGTAQTNLVTEPAPEETPRYELVTYKDPVVIPKMAKPEPLEPYTDPAFGTRITRISSAEPGQVVKPMYNTIQSWNADESLLLLYHTGEGGAGHHLYDGKNICTRALWTSCRVTSRKSTATRATRIFFTT